MYPSLEDVVLLVRSALLEDDNLSLVVGKSVYGSHPNTPDDPSTSYPMVIIEVESGRSVYGSGYQSVTVHLYTYSRNSAGDAISIYDLANRVINGRRLQDDGIDTKGYLQEEYRPDSGYNDAVKAYFCRGSFRARTVS